ncbi:PREDICTED: uncharacterized protein LOC108778324 [Cyphomyrmex costatus]|uniref:uncharacterized protein LOC108778324 n=1 Tax=Cyphomyrmex costatus TaxID=456900 RepID=UPI0008522A2D|nr:PREDICTED: uncharacterized protein LOC108778324 [Cyphomyrmex costatus]
MNEENEEEWNKKNLKAMNFIYCSITNQQLEFIGDEDTALKIMNKFDSMYLKKSTALQICVRNRLDKMKLRDFEDSSTFFSEFEKAINDLKSAGARVSEREKLDYMLKMLPDFMCYIGDLIDSVQESERTCEFLKNKISMWELKSRGTEKKKYSAFKAEKKDGSCRGCGKFGHFVKDCWATGKVGSGYKGNGFGRGGNSGESQTSGARASGSHSGTGAPGEGADATTAGEGDGRHAEKRRATTPSSWMTHRPELS